MYKGQVTVLVEGGVCVSTSCSQLQNCHLVDFGHCALAKPCLSLHFLARPHPDVSRRNRGILHCAFMTVFI